MSKKILHSIAFVGALSISLISPLTVANAEQPRPQCQDLYNECIITTDYQKICKLFNDIEDVEGGSPGAECYAAGPKLSGSQEDLAKFCKTGCIFSSQRFQNEGGRRGCQGPCPG